MKAIVILEVKDNNGRKKVKRIVKDLGVNNFGRFLVQLFAGTAASASRSASLVDVGGSTRTVYIYRTVTGTGLVFNCTSVALPKRIKVGDSSTAPAKTDYNLKGTVLGTCDVVTTWSDGGDYVDISGTFSWTENKVVYEVGYFFVVDVGGSAYEIMFDRTVISGGISVPANQVLTVTYRIMI